MPGTGQVVIAAGDALIRLEPSVTHLGGPGITALGALSPPDEAARHGVLCPNVDGSVRLYLQKPDVRAQRKRGVIPTTLGCQYQAQQETGLYQGRSRLARQLQDRTRRASYAQRDRGSGA